MGKKACTQIAWTERSSSGARTERTRTVKWELLQESQPYQTCTHYEGPVAILYFMLSLPFRAFQWLGGKESTCQFRRCRGCGFSPWVRKILWRRKWQPTPVLLPGKPHGHRSLVGYSPQGCKELDMTKWLSHMHLCSLSQMLGSKKSNDFLEVTPLRRIVRIFIQPFILELGPLYSFAVNCSVSLRWLQIKKRQCVGMRLLTLRRATYLLA